MQTLTNAARPRAGRMPRLERVAREKESLEAVIESIGGETELQPLLTRILQRACELIGADDGAIGLVDETRDVVRIEAIYQMPPSELGTELARGAGLAGHVLAAGAPVLMPRYGDFPGINQSSLVENAVIGVPISWRDRIIGIFGLGRAPRVSAGRRRRRPFAAADAEALLEFARHAAIAIENVHRHGRERLRAERARLIARVGQLVTADLRRQELLQRAADAIHELLGYENVAIALIAADDPEALDFMAFGGLYKQIIGRALRLPISTGLMGAAARLHETVLVNDVAADPRHIPAPGVVGVVAELAVPILVGGRVLGVLNVESRHTFSEEDAEGLRVVAGQLAVAIENARLYVAAQRAAVLDERQRLARELHDSVAQQLFSATLVAQAVGPAYARDHAEGDRRAAMLLGLTRTALGEMRELLTELRPLRPDFASTPAYESTIANLSRDGLVRALKAHVASPALAGLPVSIVSDGYAAQSPAREEALFRIAQEALHNVVKHARATRVEVRLESVGGVARLLVRDDGVGIPQGAKRRRASDMVPNSLGLMTMRERAAELGGALRVDSASDGGTIIEADIPLDADGSA